MAEHLVILLVYTQNNFLICLRYCNIWASFIVLSRMNIFLKLVKNIKFKVIIVFKRELWSTPKILVASF